MPTIESGTATPGISVAERFLRNRKITITTRHTVSTSVNSTSRMEPRIDSEASKATSSFTEGGISLRNTGSRRRMLSTTSTVFVPGWRWMARITPRTPPNQAAAFSFSTLSRTRPSCSSLTGVPFRQATMTGRYSAALINWPVDSTVNACLLPCSRPVGRFTLLCRMARCTSSMPMPRAASSSGFTCTRTAYFWLP